MTTASPSLVGDFCSNLAAASWSSRLRIVLALPFAGLAIVLLFAAAAISGEPHNPANE